jgi:hypothetical protein
VFPDFLSYLRIKQVRFCTQKGIQATHFSSLNEQISLKLLVAVAPKIEANLKHLTDSIDFSFFSFNSGGTKVHDHVEKYGSGQLKSKYL